MDTYIIQVLNGISLSSILLLTALGLSITFGLMHVINMAHGEFLMIGAYTTYVVQNIFKACMPEGLFDLYYLFALIFSFIIAALIGLILEATIIKHLYGRPLDSLLVTWGISLVLQQAARSIFGTPNVEVKSPSFLNGGIALTHTIAFPIKRLFIIALVIVICTSIYFILYKSKSGLKVRAVMQNRKMASCLGVPTRQVDAYTFAVGSGLAGIAGCALTLLGSIGSSLGTNYIVDTFMTVVLGGVGRIAGTAFGALFMGIGNTTLEFMTNTSLGKVLILMAVITFLQFKPKGMFTINSRSLDE